MPFLEGLIYFAALIQAYSIDQSSDRLHSISSGGFRLHAATVGVYISRIQYGCNPKTYITMFHTAAKGCY